MTSLLLPFRSLILGFIRPPMQRFLSKFFFTVTAAGRLGTMKLKSQQNSTR